MSTPMYMYAHVYTHTRAHARSSAEDRHPGWTTYNKQILTHNTNKHIKLT